MAGLYIHFPFCRKKCAYCDFYSVSFNKGGISTYLDALINEITLRKEILSFDTEIQSIYLGGGTPSLINTQQIERIFKHIYTEFRIAPNAEITIEINPGSVDFNKILCYKHLGINRISIGIQSFQENILQRLRRQHKAEEAIEIFHSVQRAGIENIGIDLIYGIPFQTMEEWEKSIQIAIDLKPFHISAYALSWSNKTDIGREIIEGTLPVPDEERVSDMYLKIHDLLIREGFLHYEVSNFARPGFRCVHNEAYWTGKPYLGFGPSAHSFSPGKRFWNISDINKYCSVLSHNQLPIAGEEVLNKDQKRLEKLTLSLRRDKGLSISELKGKEDRIEILVSRQLATIQKGFLSLTAEGFLLADEVAVQLVQ